MTRVIEIATSDHEFKLIPTPFLWELIEEQ
jgi:hypothetical protein